MNFISTKKAAELWQISQRRVVSLASSGRIPGATLLGNRWVIPENAPKPADGRTQNGKNSENIPFRFPMYLSNKENYITVPLTGEEQKLMQAQKDFHACRFAKAQACLSELTQSKNKYIRISAYYHRFLCALFTFQYEVTKSSLKSFQAEFLQDFPYKKEMELFGYLLSSSLGRLDDAVQSFSFEKGYCYHPSCYFVYLYLSFTVFSKGDFTLINKINLSSYELICQIMEEQGHYYEAQELYFSLFIAYNIIADEESSEYYLRKALEIGFANELYYLPAAYLSYFSAVFKKVLRHFPHEQTAVIYKNGARIHQSLLSISSKNKTSTAILTKLEDIEYQLVLYAVLKISNKTIAGLLDVSVSYVGKRYSGIYEKLGVKSKNELAEYYNRTVIGITKPRIKQ